MATESKRMRQVRGTASEATSANPVLGAGELGYETDTGKFKIGDGTTAWNSLTYHTHTWSEITGKPSTFAPSSHTHLQSEVDGLVSALAGKAATSHTQDWSTITGVPYASAGTAGIVKVGTGLAISGGGVLSATGGGGSGTDLGFIFDIRDYGAIVGPSNARTNTLAIQEAVDAAAVQSGGNGGGEVFVPAVERQNATMYDIETPIWLPGDNVLIAGLSKESTVIRSQGPCFVSAKHPRYWDIERKILTDKTNGAKYVARQYENQLTGSELSAANPTLEAGQVVYLKNPSTGVPTGEYKTGPGAYNSLSLSTGATVFPTPELAYFSRYKIDLREFRSGGAFPPGSQPEFGPVASLSTGQNFALRSWSGAVKGTYWYHPIGNGDNNQTNQWASRWPDHSAVTWQCVIQHLTAVWWGGIFGVGSENNPGPFILFGAGDSLSSPTTGTYYFDLALTDAGGIRKTWLRFTFAQNATTGIHRIAIQFNPAASTVADRLVVFVDRVRVAVTVQDLTSSYPGYDGNTGNILTTNRVARWNGSQVAILSESDSVGGFAVGQQHPYLYNCDGIFIAASVHTKLLYQTTAVGTAQIKVGSGVAADDSTVWGPTDSSSATEVLGYLFNSYEWTPNDVPTLAMYLGSNRNMGKGAAGAMGFFGPRYGAHGTAQAPSGNTIANLTLRRYEGWSNGAPVIMSSFINTTTIRDCNLADQGYFKAIGCHTSVASYYLYVEDCNLGRGVHFSNATVIGKNWTFTYTVDSYVRASGCKFRLDGMTTAAIQSRDEAVFIFEAGSSIGSGTYLSHITCNFEGLTFQPQSHLIYLERTFATAGDGIWIRDSVFGESAAPFLYLADYVGSTADGRTATVELQNVGFSTPNAAVVAQGNQWRTEKSMIEVGLSAYTSKNMVEYVNAKDGRQYNAVTTVLRNGHGIPQSGGFVRGSHRVEILNPSEGGPTGWECVNADDTTRKKEGTNDTPTWRTIGRNPSRNSSALSANFFPGLHFTCNLSGWNSGGTKSVEFSGITRDFSRRLLAKTLNATSTAAPTHFRLAWGYYNVYLESRSYPAGFFDTGALSLASFFGTAAASGQKANTAAITANGLNVPSWDVRLTRPACGFAEFGDSNVGVVGGQGAFAFLTTDFTPADWAITTSNNPVIAIGGLTIKRSDRTSGYTDWLTNRQVDWMTGTSWTPPATWYFGFSTTDPSQPGGTGITEPSGGSYARVAVTANTTNFGELRDSSFFANRTAIQWPQPTGDWGEPLYVVAYDASSGGNVMGVAPINFPIRITASSRPPVFYPGAMVFQI